ncbi:MAG: nitroreductase [Oscillospiraceae bacterium]|nr:nitroreductase [Oscillospiraceae bacterium]
MENAMELMRARHSVRQYLEKPIPQEVRQSLDEYAARLNGESGLHLQLVYDEPACFDSPMAHYGSFANCANYIAVVGRRSPGLEERCGYYGELLVLKAQELGLNTCWVALTHGKSKAAVAAGEKEVILIALGYGKTRGVPHKSKAPERVSDLAADSPDWYRRGVEAALLAPTAINQQKFTLRRDGDRVSLTAGRLGTNLQVDLGIVKCHFELGAGKENFRWA